jgi:hypothetical protein
MAIRVIGEEEAVARFKKHLASPPCYSRILYSEVSCSNTVIRPNAQSGLLSFAGGHEETWRWPRHFKHKQSYWKRAKNAANLADLMRLLATTLSIKVSILLK